MEDDTAAGPSGLDRLPFVGWSVVACALAVWAPAGQVYVGTHDNVTGTRGLVLGSLALVICLRLRPQRRWWAALLTVAVAAAQAAVVIPITGRAPVAVTWILVGVAHATLVEWRPLRRWPDRGVGQAWAAVPFVLGAGIAWRVTGSLVPTLALAAASLGLVEWSARAPSGAAAIDRGVRAGAAWAVGGVVGAVVAAFVGLGRAAGASARGLRWLIGLSGLDLAVRYLRDRLGDLGRWRRAPTSRRDRSLVAAVAVGFVLRTWWAVAMTVSSARAEWYSKWNFTYAESFAHGHGPRYAGVHTAYWPPGYGATLAPLQWISDRWGWFDIGSGAAAVNVVASTITIGLVAALAARWFGPGARNPAAWIMAVAFGHIFATSAGVGETLAAMLFVLAVLAATIVVDRAPATLAPFVAVGIGIGYPALVKDFGVLLVLVPALCIRARRGSWRGALRPTLAVLAGTVVVLAPWAVRNGVQVGVWSPFSTVNSDSLCYTRYEVDWLKFEAAGGPATMSRAMLEDCNRNSPLDNPNASDALGVTPQQFRFDHPDEPRWVKRETRLFLRWFIHNPLYLPSVSGVRIYDTAGSDSQGGLTLATQSGSVKIAGPLAMLVYQSAADAWYYAVLGLCLVGVIRLKRVRRAVPLWAIAIFLALYTIPGPRALSRHYFIAYPFLAVMASAAVAAIAAIPFDRDDPVEGSGQESGDEAPAALPVDAG